ncbi:hypothetical protein C8R43DRAFT_954400 [Mycena crocata]|nr:hypothetical protein C8R43DRAFT_954400 [Mycena crocata]
MGAKDWRESHQSPPIASTFEARSEVQYLTCVFPASVFPLLPLPSVLLRPAPYLSALFRTLNGPQLGAIGLASGVATQSVNPDQPPAIHITFKRYPSISSSSADEGKSEKICPVGTRVAKTAPSVWRMDVLRCWDVGMLDKILMYLLQLGCFAARGGTFKHPMVEFSSYRKAPRTFGSTSKFGILFIGVRFLVLGANLGLILAELLSKRIESPTL